MEPDPRHAEILIRDLDGDSGKLVTTPMTKDDIKESVESITEDVYEKARNGKTKRGRNRVSDCDELDDDQITKYRALVARANYLAVDRGDISFCQRIGSLHVITIKTRLGKAQEVGKILKTQASVCTMVCISRYDTLTVTGPDAKGHADPPLVDACCGIHTLSKCGVGHKPW